MDVFGNALSDFFKKGTAEVLTLHNSYDDAEEMPVDIFFRNEDDLPVLEALALNECRGKVLDIGAGVGSHAIILQERGLDVTAMDYSLAAIEVMKHRGIKNTIQADFFTLIDAVGPKSEKYDTLLFMMNGIGITGTLPGFRNFLDKVQPLLRPGGQLLFDSSDIRYLYTGQPLPSHHYYGEVSYQYEYQGQKGAWFHWLYVDLYTVQQIAAEMGWKCELLFDDREDQYLARLTRHGM